MKKVLFAALAVALVLAGCGGGGKSNVIKVG
jgi:predicted small secreted protein